MAPAVLTFTLVFAALFGLVIGSFLNVVVYRVPAGVPLTRESRCPHCDHSIRWWQNIPVLSWIALRGRCAACRAPISARYPLVETFTGLSFVAVVWFFLATDVSSRFARSTTEMGAWALAVVIVAFLYFASISIALTLIDLDTHRLPNVIVLPSYLVAIALLTLACVLGADWWALLHAGIGMAALYAFYFVIRLIRPDGMGGGDVKLAGIVGLYLAWLGWAPLAVGAFAAFLIGGVFGILLLALRRAGRKTAIPFGPWMILGAWVGVFTGEWIARWYLGVLGGTA